MTIVYAIKKSSLSFNEQEMFYTQPRVSEILPIVYTNRNIANREVIELNRDSENHYGDYPTFKIVEFELV